MEEEKCLSAVRAWLKKQGWSYAYHEEDGLGSIDFDYRGVPYHIWEFEEGERGVETNLRHGGRQEELTGDYEKEILRILDSWLA